jgi:hypothetical protein
MNRLSSAWVGLCLLGALGCEGIQSKDPAVYRPDLKTESGEPAYIAVQHCLIAFDGSLPGKDITRSMEEAEQLANELLERAQQGEDFGKIVAKYTDDAAPGIYKMANTGFPGDMTSRITSNQVYARNQMVAAFGDTGFPLEVGEYGLAPFDSEKSPYGWHIVKRIE